MREIRNNMDICEIDEKSVKICEQVEKIIQEEELSSIMVFISFRNEVNTYPLIDKLIEQEKTVLAPLMDGTKKELLPYQLSGKKNELVRNHYGIDEPNPKVCHLFPVRQLDLVLVPGLAFDRKGYRIGYGGGYYDRFLRRCPQAIWLGLAYEKQLIDEIPHENWDVPVNFIATEEGIIKC